MTPPSAKPLSDCAVAITGGTSGVGLATAHAFAAAGVTRIALIGRDPQRGAAARQNVLNTYPDLDLHYVRADAADETSAASAAHTVNALLEGLDVLVNSTRPQWTPELLKRTPIASLRHILHDQAMPPIHMCAAALPYMTERQFGVMINIASESGQVATPAESVTGAGMAAIVTFTRALAAEAQPDGIRVNVTLAHPGAVEAADLTSLIVFLAGPGAARITGQAISVSGGIPAA